MKHYRVWIQCQHAGVSPHETTLEFEDAATKDQIEKECRSAWLDLINDHVDGGWQEEFLEDDDG